ncbi:MAG: SoxR reducing system RseC family protein [Tannerellaceae bacterium]|jgi:positive regulator of sigma E activity|nr:SoxR reducing system RseC family protein [Tannerellaceae bacterium]
MTNRDKSTFFCGTINRIDGNKAYVTIQPVAACLGCAAQSLCASATKRENIIEAELKPGAQLQVNDNVTLKAAPSVGIFSASIAFFIPLAIVVGAIALTVALLGWDEVAGASAGLSAGALWYAGLYICRRALARKLIFEVEET